MRKIFILFFFIFTISNGIVYAYDEETTHPALTQEVVEFYNLLHPEQKLTEEEKELIISGSIKEDEWPRWINHFYDPVNKVGWTGEKQGNVPSYIVRILSNVAVSIEGARSAIDWLNNPLVQESYARYGGNRTWKKGLEYFSEGNSKEAYITLGHALHLLEDMSVPEHSRNDTHAPFKEATGDEGSPFENYLRKWTRSSIGSLNLPKKLYGSGAKPPAFPAIGDYLINLATYSNKYFFSKDTINDLKYQFPKIVRDDGNYGYGIDENGQEFPLAKSNLKTNENNEIAKYYTLKNVERHYPILNSYFSRLAPKAILYGAGVIELFKKQAADEAINREFPAQLVKYDFSFITPKNFSLAAEGKKLILTAQTFLANAAETASTVFDNLVGSSGNKAESIAEAPRLDEPPSALRPVASETAASQPAVAQPVTTQQAVVNSSLSVSAPPVSNFPSTPVVSVSVSLAPTPVVNATVTEKSFTNAISTSTATSTDTTATSTATSILSISSEQVTSTDSAATSTATSTVPITTSTDPIATSTATSTDSTTTSSFILISEIYPDKTGNNYDFVELYNKATSSIDLSNYSLRILRNGATTSESLAVFSGENITQIPANGFFLVGFDDYNSGNFKAADIFRSSRFLPTTESARIILRASGRSVDEFEYDPALAVAGNSFERKAVSNNECVSSQNDSEFLGNGCDTDNSLDWEVRSSANPQNSQSLPEPREAPQISDFNGSWSTSTQEITLNWGESADVLGATSSVAYELEDSDSQIIFSGTSTYRFVFSVEEAGLDYSFYLRAVDRDGLAGAVSSLTITTTSTTQAASTSISEWSDSLTSFSVNAGNSPSLGTFLAATTTYTGPDQFVVGSVTLSAVDGSENNHAPCCNFLFIVFKDQNGRALATSTAAGPQFGGGISFNGFSLPLGSLIEYYVKDIQAGSNWIFSGFVFHRAEPPPTIATTTEPALAYQLDASIVGGPFSTGQLGQIYYLFQYLGMGWLQGTTITAFEIKYQAPSPWHTAVIGVPDCSNLYSSSFNLNELRDFSLETIFEPDVLKVYKYTGSVAFNENMCYAVMVQFSNRSDNNYLAGTSIDAVVRPDYVTDRDGCLAKNDSGGNVGSCVADIHGSIVRHAFFKIFPPN